MTAYFIAESIYDVHPDVADVLEIADSCATGLGRIADQFGVAMASAEREVSAAATAQCSEALAYLLARTAAESMTSLGGGIRLMTCWLRVTQTPEHFNQLLECLGHLAAVNSTRFGLQSGEEA